MHLFTTLNEDPNVNVRLATLEALVKLAGEPRSTGRSGQKYKLSGFTHNAIGNSGCYGKITGEKFSAISAETVE